MKTGFDYYRIKMQWKGELEDGSLEKVKTEDLVYATSYTEAEQVAYALIDAQNRTKHDEIYSLEIVKTKISDMLFNDSLDQDTDRIGDMVYNFFPQIDGGEGFYAVKVLIIRLDERTAKEKRTYETVYTPATDNHDAAKRVQAYLSSEEIVIRDVRFDNAESVLWPESVFNQKSKSLA